MNEFLDGKVTLRTGNCAEIVESMPDNSVDSVVCDPPYALVSITKRFGKPGSAARFFYTAKADADDRLGFKHPTIKPVDLMQWLVRLVTPKGGLVLDPFAGTGTTGEAAWREGMRCVLIEREEEYQGYIRRRMHLAERPAERTATAKSKGVVETAGPLFGDVA